MTDPFTFYREAGIDGDPYYRAPVEAVRSWLELAEQACAALRDCGIHAYVYPVGPPSSMLEELERYDSVPPSGGAQLEVHAIAPFGVLPAWVPPFAQREEHFEKLYPWSPEEGRTISPLGRYVSHSKRIAISAVMEVLRQRGFRVYYEHIEGQQYQQRVLASPEQ